MAQKRASDEPEPEAKRAAPSAHILESMTDYRTLLEHCGQTLAVQLWCASEDHRDAIDAWVCAQSTDIIARAILRMLPQYDAAQAIVASLLRRFPAVWTTPIDGEPFVWRLYSSDCGNSGALEPLIIELCTTEIANCADSDGNTLLYYATELMHAYVVEHLLLKLRCDVPVNKHGHHALFAPLLHASVEFEPMQKIIRAFLYARQRRPQVFDTALCVNGLTVLGWLLKYPYPELVRTWLKRRDPSETLAPGIYVDAVKVGDVIDGIGEITSDMASLLTEFTSDKFEVQKTVAFNTKNGSFFKQVILDGANESVWRHCSKNAPGIHTGTFSTFAIRLNDAELLDLSITHFGNMENTCQCGNQRQSLIMQTVLSHNPHLFEILVKHGAKIDFSSRLVVESLVMQMVTVPQFHEILISLLPSFDLNVVYSNQKIGGSKICKRNQPLTLLGASAWSNNRALVAALLKHGARPNMQLPYDDLYMAISTGKLAFVELLLNHGAIPSALHLRLAAFIGRAVIFERLRPLVFDAADVFERFAKTPISLLTCEFCTHEKISPPSS